MVLIPPKTNKLNVSYKKNNNIMKFEDKWKELGKNCGVKYKGSLPSQCRTHPDTKISAQRRFNTLEKLGGEGLPLDGKGRQQESLQVLRRKKGKAVLGELVVLIGEVSQCSQIMDFDCWALVF